MIKILILLILIIVLYIIYSLKKINDDFIDLNDDKNIYEKEKKRKTNRFFIILSIFIFSIYLKPSVAFAEQKTFNIDFYNHKIVSSTSGLSLIGSFENSDIKLNFYYKSNTGYKYYFPIIFKDNISNKYLISGLSSDTSDILNQDIFDFVSLGFTKDVNPFDTSVDISYPPNVFLYKNNSTVCNVATGCSNLGIDINYYINRYNFYSLDISNSTLSSNYSLDTFSSRFKNGNIEFVGSSIPTTISIGTDVLSNSNSFVIPENYSELDLTGKDGVIFWPKDLRNIPNNCDEIDSSITGSASVCVYDKYSYDFYLKGSLAYTINDFFYSNVQSQKNTLKIFEEYTLFSVNVDKNESIESIMFYNNNDLTSGVGVISQSKIVYNSDLLNYHFINDISDQDSFEMTTIDINGNTQTSIFTGVSELRDLSEINYSFNDDVFSNNNVFDYIKEFFSGCYNSFSFFKSNLLKFTNSLPGILYGLVITIPIIVLILFSWRNLR